MTSHVRAVLELDKPRLDFWLCHSVCVTSPFSVCICEMGTVMVPALGVGVPTGGCYIHEAFSSVPNFCCQYY